MADSNEYMKTFFAGNPIPKETLEYFSSLPWTRSIVQDERYEPVPTFSRVLKPSGEDYFFSKTINTPITVPHYLTLRVRDFKCPPITKPTPPSHTTVPSHKQKTVVPDAPDCLFLIHLGEKGVDGHPGVAHGGVVCALMDETMGLMVMLHQNEVAGDGARDLLFTINLSVNFREKVPTPSEILIKTWLTKREERKWYSKGQIVDKEGNVLIEADGLWIVPRPRL